MASIALRRPERNRDRSNPNVPAGIPWSWLQDKAQIGTLLDVRPPSGQFVCAPDANAPPVFIAGGIGITPILSMLKSAFADQPDRAAQLFYGVRSGQDCAFTGVLSPLAEGHPGLALHILHAGPATENVQGRGYDLPGFISLDLLKQTVPHGRHPFYICGPDPMMKALVPELLDWSVDEADIHRESFGPQTAALKPLAPRFPVWFGPSGFAGLVVSWIGGGRARTCPTFLNGTPSCLMGVVAAAVAAPARFG